MDKGEIGLIVVGLLLFYVSPAVLLYRGATELSVMGRAILAALLPPVFFALTALNIHLSAQLLPFLFEELGTHRRDGVIAFVIAFPIAGVFTYLFFRVLKWRFPSTESRYGE